MINVIQVVRVVKVHQTIVSHAILTTTEYCKEMTVNVFPTIYRLELFV